MSAQWEYQRPFMYGKQLDAIFCQARYAFIEASTKSGKTHGCIVWLLELAILAERPGRNYWWVAPVNSQTEIAFTRVKNAIPRDLYTANENDKKITLVNGSIIWFKSGDTPDSLYGEDVYGCVIDEGSRCKEDVFFAIRSTLTATKGPLRVIGNVKGRLTWTYKMGKKAKREMEKGSRVYSYSRLTAWDAVEGGILDKEEIEDAEDMLPEMVFRELYLAEPADDGGNPFGIKDIELCKQPMQPAKGLISIGIDLAKKHDWTVITALNDDGGCCAFDRFQAPWIATIPRLANFIRKFPGCRVLVDATGVGDPVLEALQQELSYNFNVEGYVFSTQSKQRLMEGLAVSIQKHKVSILEGVMMDEMMSFGYEYTKTGVRYSAPAGDHDDCVMSFALANYLFYVPNIGWAADPEFIRKMGLNRGQQIDGKQTTEILNHSTWLRTAA
jgi:hypothetical protein